MTLNDALSFVRAELTRAQATYPAFHSGHEGYAVIREELDELWSAVKAEKSCRHYTGQPALEAVQVAAMAIRFLVDVCEADASDFIGGYARSRSDTR